MEEYLRRVAGIASITWVLIVAVAGLITLESDVMASAIGMNLGTFRAFTWSIAVIAGFSVVMYSAISSGMSVARLLPKEEIRPKQIFVTVIPGLVLLVVILALAVSMVYFGGLLGYPVAFPLFLVSGPCWSTR